MNSDILGWVVLRLHRKTVKRNRIFCIKINSKSFGSFAAASFLLKASEKEFLLKGKTHGLEYVSPLHINGCANTIWTRDNKI
ncbi:MAG: hypothetical protein M3367_00910 [Acidobacteriota bacterium]|nr:hypothetical protein [Acidobacteriota bacterium]